MMDHRPRSCAGRQLGARSDQVTPSGARPGRVPVNRREDTATGGLGSPTGGVEQHEEPTPGPGSPARGSRGVRHIDAATVVVRGENGDWVVRAPVPRDRGAATPKGPTCMLRSDRCHHVGGGGAHTRVLVMNRGRCSALTARGRVPWSCQLRDLHRSGPSS